MNTPNPITPRDIAESLDRHINGGPLLTDTTLSQAGPSLLTNVDDPTGPNGGRSFIITVREVDPAPEVIASQVAALAGALSSAAESAAGVLIGPDVAAAIAERLILTGAVLA